VTLLARERQQAKEPSFATRQCGPGTGFGFPMVNG
jgi:hypothetical protein